MNKNNKDIELEPEDVLRWFRQGADTAKIAYLLRVSESVVANVLARARENERDHNNNAVPAQCEPPVEHD
jgi:hypothetical protein